MGKKAIQREHLVRRGPLTVPRDLSRALDDLENLASEYKWKLKLTQNPAPDVHHKHLSLQPAGREVLIEAFPDANNSSRSDRQHRVVVVWSLAVPLGFTPLLRYPLAGGGDTIFHFFGPWQNVMDRMSAEGRGELSWPSVCCATQVDVGKWDSGRTLERFVQAQLHRMGINCGPIDGVIGDRTVDSFQALGIKGKTLDQIADYLRDLDTPAPKRRELTLGHIIMPGRKFTVSPHGPIGVVRHRDRVSMSIGGPGRVILDIGGLE